MNTHTHKKLTPDAKAAEAHVAILMGNANAIATFQVFDDKGENSKLARTIRGKLSDVMPVLTKANERGCGVFISVNKTDDSGKRGRKHMKRTRAQFLDLDNKKPLSKKWGITPHLILESSPCKFQVLWTVESSTDFNAWSDNQARLAAYYDGDPSVNDPARVMRLAGFWHQKRKPFQVHIVSQDDLIERLPLKDVAEAHPCDYRAPRERQDEGRSEEPVGGWDNEADVTRAREWLLDADEAVEGDNGDHKTYATAAMLRDFGVSEEMAFELMNEHWNPRCSPPWNNDELRTKIVNAYRYAANPAGANSIANLFDGVEESEDELADDELPDNKTLKSGGLDYIVAENVKPEKIDWLWEGRWAVGKLNVLAGHPDEGKSQIMCYMASVISKGGTWTDGAPCERGTILILHGEDGIADTMRPRLEAASADLSKCVFVKQDIRIGKDGKTKQFNIAEDREKLTSLLEKFDDVRLLVIDPVNAYLGSKIDSYKATEVRSVLAPLASWSEKHRIATVYVAHLNKSGTGRALGRMSDSAAFGAAARMGWMATPDPRDDAEPGARILTNMKKNISRDVGGLAYHIESVILPGGINAPRIVWDGSVDISADFAVEATRNGDTKPSVVDAAKEFLEDNLFDKPMLQSKLKTLAEKAGLSWISVKRAKKKLDIKSVKQDEKPYKWEWHFPEESSEMA